MKLKHILLTLLCLALLAAPAAAAGGAGTAASPYIIQSPEELQSVANDLSAYYALGNDIDMSGYSFTPIGSTAAPFHGSLDGRNHTIRNLNIDLPSTQYVGLFAVITAGTTIRDLNFADCTISGGANTGTLYGRCIGISGVSTPFTITDVDLTDCSITASGSNSGGLGGADASAAVGTISYCDVKNCTVTSASYNVGGLLGFGSNSGGYSEIESNHVHDCVIESSASYAVGGLLGSGSSSDGSECYVRENAVENCVMTASYIVGGLLGSGSNSRGLTEIDGNAVENCTVKARNSYAGGIAGCYYAAGFGNITDCTVSNTTVQASSYAGGICSTFART